MQRRISAREVKRQVQTQTEGLIIKSRDINENDTVVKILTGDLGLISAFANGTKKVKSRTASAAEAHEFLSLTLNLLHLMSEDKRSADFLKPVGELRMLALAGYMPDLAGCQSCGNELPDEPVFSLRHAGFFCRNCAPDGEGIPVTPGVINAMRHICTCDDRALFAFRMPDSSLKILGDITERYLLLQLGHKLRTLDFYKSIKT